MDDLLQDFIAETREMLEAIAGEIVAWEADPSDRARLDEIFRFVHTVKGSCGFLDLPRLARLSHAAEDVLSDLRSGKRVADTGLVSAVLGVVDRIGELAGAIEAGASLPNDEDHRLIAALAETPNEATSAPAPLPAAAFHHESSRPRALARTVRLPVELLDRMMGGVSDMVLARNELSRRLREADVDPALEAAFERLSASVAEMRDAITRTRMQRIENVFSTLPRLVRDLSAETGKRVALEVEGGDVELDREMIEMVRDPLIHVVRNAIDHGIEPPEERRALGKPASGRITVSARQSGNQILIEIADDGRGIDGDKVARKAIAAGFVSAEAAAALDPAQKLAFIFRPGLSTAETITTISGRGVGLDVVRANIERIRGHVEVTSRPGAGSRMLLRVPLTLTIIPALTLSVGGCRFAIPRAAVDEIVRCDGDRVRIDRFGGGEMATIRGRRMPMARLAAVLGVEDAGRDAEVAEPDILIVLRPAGGATYALAVDAVHDHEELVVRPAAPPIMECGLYGGTTLPDTGQPMLLLDPAGIAAAARIPAPEVAPEAPAADEPEAKVPTLLFRDLDGVVRGIRLTVVERIETVAADAIVRRDGRMQLVQDARIVPLLARAALPAEGDVTFLRLSDGAAMLGYAIAAVIDIRALDARMLPAPSPGAIAGMLLVDGQPVELLDPIWLFAEAAAIAPAPLARGALAVRADQNDRWAREVLRPLFEAAGYRVRFVAADEPADLVIASGADDISGAGGAQVLRLHGTSDTGAPGSVYRYDRDALLGAAHTAAGGHG